MFSEEMAGSYTKKEFGVGPEEQTLLRESNGGTRIVHNNSKEPVRLSPGWEGTGRPDDELNFKGVTMDQADLELNSPKDRLNIVYLIMLLHGIGALLPWNMFITAKNYFTEFKLSKEYTGMDSEYVTNFLPYVAFAAQIPNVLFNWFNLFVPLGGNLTTRIVWGIFMQVLVFVFTVVLAMIDSSTWSNLFFWITMVSVVVLNTANGIYQNSVFGMAAKLPSCYTGAVILGSNISGTFTATVSFISRLIAPNNRTAAIYYFITALFVLLACFDTYFALPINRFYRHHELLYQKELNKKKLVSNSSTPYWKVFKQCWLQCFNVWFVFAVTLSVFPSVQSDIKQSDVDFLVKADFYSDIMCFLTFNITALIGSFLASCFQLPSPRFVVIPILLRAVYVPLFLLCKYQPANIERVLPIYIDSDWTYFAIAVTMGLTSGYFSSVAMMYCSRVVERQYASTAGMFGAAFLVTGVFSGILIGMLMPSLITFNWLN